ncbi:hypothetical protein O3S80_10430 [Streptomyces sp. Lzd4kr]|nr:hypothetical protein [Streptomyces sp. Lzd4kr]
MWAQIRRWRLHLRRGSSLADLAREINPIVRGWSTIAAGSIRPRWSRA